MGEGGAKLKICTIRDLTTYIRWHLEKRRQAKQRTQARSVRRRIDALARLHAVLYGCEMEEKMIDSVRLVSRSLPSQTLVMHC
jgi:hypothetical protein